MNKEHFLLLEILNRCKEIIHDIFLVGSYRRKANPSDIDLLIVVKQDNECAAFDDLFKILSRCAWMMQSVSVLTTA
jgi:predicted nucleotidyltransferase